MAYKKGAIILPGTDVQNAVYGLNIRCLFARKLYLNKGIAVSVANNHTQGKPGHQRDFFWITLVIFMLQHGCIQHRNSLN